MPTYRVILTKRQWRGGNKQRNPFLTRLAEANLLTPSDWVTIEREWTFEADSPEHVKKLYDEAVELKLEQVVGFELASVKEIV